MLSSSLWNIVLGKFPCWIPNCASKINHLQWLSTLNPQIKTEVPIQPLKKNVCHFPSLWDWNAFALHLVILNVRPVVCTSTSNKRAYPTSWLDAALEKVHYMDVSQPSAHNLVKKCCYLYHSPLSKDVANIIRKHWNVLSANPICKKLFSKSPILAYYRAKNMPIPTSNMFLSRGV